MGARTQRFISELDVLARHCEPHLLTITREDPVVAHLHQQRSQLLEAHARRIADMPVATAEGASGQRAGREQALSDDPELQRIDRQLVDLQQQLEHHRPPLERALHELGRLKLQLLAKVGEFERFVNAKAASWFGGKKSVLMARVFIKDTKGFVVHELVPLLQRRR